MKFALATVFAVALVKPAVAATFLFCQFPNPKHVTGFDSIVFIFDGDRLKQAGGTYSEPDENELSVQMASKMRIMTFNDEVLTAGWEKSPRNGPSFEMNRRTGIVEATAFGDGSLQIGICVLKEHALDGSPIGG